VAFGSSRDSYAFEVFGPRGKWGGYTFGSSDPATTSSDVGGGASGLRTTGKFATDDTSVATGFGTGNGLARVRELVERKRRVLRYQKRNAPAQSDVCSSSKDEGEMTGSSLEVDSGDVSGNKPKGASGSVQAATFVASNGFSDGSKP
jgi:hypothetical protein